MSDERSSDSASSSSAPSEADASGSGRGTAIEQRLQEVVAAYRELKDENEAFRQRTRKNAERRLEERQEQFVLKFMDILDNFDRALQAAQVSYTGNPLIDGLILVRTQILQTLQDEGLEWIPVVGRPYDPEVAEAVATEMVDDPERHHVVIKDEMRGYRLNGRLVRAARVVVGRYEGPEAVASGEDALSAAVLEAASASDAETPSQPDELIDTSAEEVPDRHTIANLADAAAEAVAAAGSVEVKTKSRSPAVAAPKVQPIEAPARGEESSDTAPKPDLSITDSGAFEIADATEESDGLEGVIQAAAEAVEGSDPEGAAAPEAEPSKEDSDESED